MEVFETKIFSRGLSLARLRPLRFVHVPSRDISMQLPSLVLQVNVMSGKYDTDWGATHGLYAHYTCLPLVRWPPLPFSPPANTTPLILHLTTTRSTITRSADSGDSNDHAA